MTDPQVISAMISLSGLAGIILICYWPLQDLVADWYRQKIFRFRNDMFIFAAQGKISFVDPAYLQIRATLERQIRFAHRATWPRILVGLLSMKGAVDGGSQIKEVISEFDAPTQAYFEKNFRRLARYFMAMLIFRSPFLLLPIFSLLFMIFYIIGPTAEWHRRVVAMVFGVGMSAADELERDALEKGWRGAPGARAA